MSYSKSEGGDVVLRRDVLKTLGAGVVLGSLGLFKSSSAIAAGDKVTLLTLPKLPYAYDALEPYIDARTMEIHHSKHHQAYVDNANKVLEKHPDWLGNDPGALLRRLGGMPEPERTALRNNLGGHVNHSFFWQILAPKAGGEAKGDLAGAITSVFGGFSQFRSAFTDAAMKRFGSGWAWLVWSKGGLVITSSGNQDSPIIEGDVPLLGLDVWEHAYYLKYQNRRAEYVAAFWNVVNWDQVGKNFAAARSLS